jgi:hypothetical protein
MGAPCSSNKTYVVVILKNEEIDKWARIEGGHGVKTEEGREDDKLRSPISKKGKGKRGYVLLAFLLVPVGGPGNRPRGSLTKGGGGCERRAGWRALAV